MLAEPAGNPPQLCCPFRNVSAADIVAMLHNQLLNFILKPGNFFLRQRNLTLSLSWPNQRPIECFRSKIGGEKRDGSKPDRFRRLYRSAKMAMIGFLHRHAAGNHQLRLAAEDSRNPLAITSNAPVDSPDAVMHLSRSVNRYDNLIEQRGDLIRTLEQQQSCR